MSNMREGAKDRISDLPESLLYHIHSFLQIEDGARTSVLSKRWNHIWTTVPILDLQTTKYTDYAETEKFMDFVDGTLFRHASNVDKFYLQWDVHLNESRVRSWISFLIRGKVKELSLYLCQEHPLVIPLSLFTCESLVSLKLQTHPNICLPKYISLPRLKRLELHRFKLSDECWNTELFSNSPVLEELVLEYCTVSMSSFCISIPTLKLLKIDTWCFERNDLRDCVFKIDAPRLVTFSYSGYVPTEFILSSFPALVEAAINFTAEQNQAAETCRLLQALAHAKYLTVYDITLEAICSAYYVSNNLLTFPNVKVVNITEVLNDDQGLVALLLAVPNLESLVFDDFMADKEEAEDSDEVEGDLDDDNEDRFANNIEGENYHGNEDDKDVPDAVEWDKIDEDENNYANKDDSWALDIATNGCLFPHLKSVCFRESVGNPRELRWVKLILRNAKALQTMTIRHYEDPDFRFLNAKSQKELMVEIPSFQRASASCVIKFCS